MKTHCKKPVRLPVLFPALLLVCCFLLAGCGRLNGGGAEEDEEGTKTQMAELPPAAPAMGIGRVMSGIVTQREELILIDPGHGFGDPGNGDAEQSYWKDIGVCERDITIVVARMLDEELQKRGFRTAMTHDGETLPADFNYDWNDRFNPDERAACINYISPDYMVSLHVNSAENQSACGAIVFYNLTSQMKWNDWSKPAAEAIARAIDDYVMISAPTKAGSEVDYWFASYAVTRDTHAAGCLIEMGYATNEVDAENMLNEDWQRSMAEGIAEGIKRFFDSKED